MTYLLLLLLIIITIHHHHRIYTTLHSYYFVNYYYYYSDCTIMTQSVRDFRAAMQSITNQDSDESDDSPSVTGDIQVMAQKGTQDIDDDDVDEDDVDDDVKNDVDKDVIVEELPPPLQVTEVQQLQDEGINLILCR
jgi:hypothetical protein